MRKIDGVRVHHKKSDEVRVDQENKTDGVRVEKKKKRDRVRVHHEKVRWGESSQ